MQIMPAEEAKDDEAKLKEMRESLDELERRGFTVNYDLLKELTGRDLRPPKKEEPNKEEPRAEKTEGKAVSPQLKAIREACKAAAKRMAEGK